MNQDYLPTVSVVIPCFNRAHRLVPTIESVLLQDYPNIQCIVVDGGSTDGSIDVLHRYEGRIEWISERDSGPADAINKGWKMCRGEIVTWLNTDDTWTVPDAVSQVVAYLQAHPEVDVVYGDCGAVDADGNILKMIRPVDWDLTYAVENCHHVIYQAASFIRRRILEEVGWLDTELQYKHDHELWYRIGLKGVIRRIPIALGNAGTGSSYQERLGHKTAANCVAMTKKFFTLPGVPDNLATKRRRAISNAYLRGAEWAWHNGRHWVVSCWYAMQAAVVDPSNAARAIRHLVGFAKAASVLMLFRILSALGRKGKRWLERMASIEVPDLTGKDSK